MCPQQCVLVYQVLYVYLKGCKLAIKQLSRKLKKRNCRIFHGDYWNASTPITFSKLQIKANVVFRQFVSSVHSQKGVAKRCLRFAESVKLQNIFEIALRKFKCEAIVQKLLSEKYYFVINNSQTAFRFLYVNRATVQIWGQSIKFPLRCKSLK